MKEFYCGLPGWSLSVGNSNILNIVYNPSPSAPNLPPPPALLSAGDAGSASFQICKNGTFDRISIFRGVLLRERQR